MITLKKCLSPSAIVLAGSASSAQEVMATLAARLGEQLGLAPELIVKAVQDREATRSTAIGHNAAIPHCRLHDLPQFAAALMSLNQPVRWDDQGHVADLVIMVAGPHQAVAAHLRLLSNCSQLLTCEPLRAKIHSAPDAAAAARLLAAAEEAVEARRNREGLLRELRREQAEGGDELIDVVERFTW